MAIRSPLHNIIAYYEFHYRIYFLYVMKLIFIDEWSNHMRDFCEIIGFSLVSFFSCVSAGDNFDH